MSSLTIECASNREGSHGGWSLFTTERRNCNAVVLARQLEVLALVAQVVRTALAGARARIQPPVAVAPDVSHARWQHDGRTEARQIIVKSISVLQATDLAVPSLLVPRALCSVWCPTP